MLFNSHFFIFIFLPICFFGFIALNSRQNRELSLSWLVLCSLFYYAWWNPEYALLIIASMIVNFQIGNSISKAVNNKKRKKFLLITGIAIDLSVIGYYKYTTFLIDTVNTLTGTDFYLYSIVLPLGISFFTFQQIAYLVDAYRDETHEYNFLHYALFVTFFPQLIAGPIVHHKEMLPQFMTGNAGKFDYKNFAVGITIFSIGLFKKVVLADGVAEFATPVFNAAENGESITFLIAWGGALSYTLQLYFDFSGYSDMAIGLARLFGIVLPLNFNSPYKAINIIDFWRRWHMTLSRFLRDYLYFPLGGNRHGTINRYRNLLLTMLLGGLWHGAGWTFVFWGILHGFYLMVNHLWHAVKRTLGWNGQGVLASFASYTLTFICVVVAWVFFRAESFTSATSIINGMIGSHGIVLLPDYVGVAEQLNQLGLPVTTAFDADKIIDFKAAKRIFFLLIFAWCLPNTQEIMRHFKPALDIDLDSMKTSRISWQPNMKWMVFTSAILVYSIANLTRISEFLYFQF